MKMEAIQPNLNEGTARVVKISALEIGGTIQSGERTETIAYVEALPNTRGRLRVGTVCQAGSDTLQMMFYHLTREGNARTTVRHFLTLMDAGKVHKGNPDYNHWARYLPRVA